MKQNLFYIILMLSLIKINGLAAQKLDTIPKHEVGILFNSINQFNLVYKKQQLKKSPYKYFRYALGIATIEVKNREVSDNLSAAKFEFAFGIEKRTPINNRFQSLNGPYFRIFSRFEENYRKDVQVLSGVGFGYILGGIYQFNEHFYVGLELIPRFDFSIIAGDRFEQVFETLSISGGFDSSSAGISIVYRFQKQT